MPTFKRKHSDDESELDSASLPSYSHTQHKRRRYDLSRNLSRLSLAEQLQTRPVVQEPPQYDQPIPTDFQQDLDISSSWGSSSSLGAMDTDTPIYEGQSVVEEPAAQAIPEIHMRHSSSYEPEKDRESYANHANIQNSKTFAGIVVTDLDSSEDESENNEGSFADESFAVSPAILARLHSSKTSMLKNIVLPPTPNDSQALVLFRPSPWAAQDAHQLDGYYRERDKERIKYEEMATAGQQVDEDAMDVE